MPAPANITTGRKWHTRASHELGEMLFRSLAGLASVRCRGLGTAVVTDPMTVCDHLATIRTGFVGHIVIGMAASIVEPPRIVRDGGVDPSGTSRQVAIAPMLENRLENDRIKMPQRTAGITGRLALAIGVDGEQYHVHRQFPFG